jgi:hypothetical protein
MHRKNATLIIHTNIYKNITSFLLYRCSVNRLARTFRDISDGTAVGPPSRYTTGVPPEIPVSNRCPVRTVNPLSVVNCGPATNSPGPEDNRETRRRLRYAKSSNPNAANRITPPSEPTIAGTRGTTGDLVVPGAVPGPLVVVGIPPVGGINTKDDVALANVVLTDDPLREAEILLAELLNELFDDDAVEKIVFVVEFETGRGVDVEEKDEVRFAGRLVTMLVEDVAEVDLVVMLDGTDEVVFTLVAVDTAVEL